MTWGQFIATVCVITAGLVTAAVLGVLVPVLMWSLVVLFYGPIVLVFLVLVALGLVELVPELWDAVRPRRKSERDQ